jgi:hypothetical protein
MADLGSTMSRDAKVGNSSLNCSGSMKFCFRTQFAPAAPNNNFFRRNISSVHGPNRIAAQFSTLRVVLNFLFIT